MIRQIVDKANLAQAMKAATTGVLRDWEREMDVVLAKLAVERMETDALLRLLGEAARADIRKRGR